MKRPFFQTLRARLVVYVFLVFAVLVLYAGWTSAFLLHNLFLQFDLRLDRGLESIVRSITVGPDGGIRVDSGSQKEYLLEIWSADAVLLYRSSSLEAQALGPAPSSNDLRPRSGGPTRLIWTSTGNKSIRLANGTRVRIAVRQHQLGNQLLVVRLGENEAFLWHEFGEMVSVLALGLPVALVIVGVTGYSVARHARIEAERRIARDMEIAKQVQARLFPQKIPTLETLEYAGRCIQARDVGLLRFSESRHRTHGDCSR